MSISQGSNNPGPQKTEASKVFGINAPAAKNAVEEHHNGKNIAKFCRNMGKKISVDEQVSAEKNKKDRHCCAHEHEGVAKAAAVADAVVG